jgi:hypothetical protein
MLRKVFTATALLAGFALASSGCSTAATAAAASDNARSITGTWTVTVQPSTSSAPSFQSTITFTTAGGVVEATSKRVSSGGIGAWTRTGDGHFSVTFRKYLFDPNGNFSGTAVIVEDDVVDPSGSSYSGHATTNQFDKNGNPAGSFTSTSQAQRMG